MMTMDERADLYRSKLGAVWNKGDLDACDEVFAEHCMFHDPTFRYEGVTGFKDFVRDLRVAQPDFHMDFQDVVAGEGMTAVRWTCGATDTGVFRGIPRTDKTYVMTGMTMSKWEGDQIVEEWTVYDMFGGMQQLGLIPEQVSQETTA